MRSATIAGRAEWLNDAGLQTLLAALSADGEEARIAGGAVRNALLGEPVTDIDVATTVVPDETIRRAEEAGFKAVPTGYQHGTITVVAEGTPYEVTTLRADIETDGRRAKVIFGRDWQKDAERRDFTINALFAEADGTVVDLVGGLSDLETRTLRFIGTAETRIREDYLRILRFFRFFAWYGEGRPEAEGLKACTRHKSELSGLSAERVWAELKKLLSAPDPSRALLWMRQTSVLTAVLPEGEKWGIDSIHPLTKTEAALGWEPDPLLRLEAILPPSQERVASVARRLKLSRAEGERLTRWAATETPAPDLEVDDFARQAYHADSQALEDRLRLALASARARAEDDDAALVEAGGYGRLLDFLKSWQRPVFPVGGDDLTERGAKPGPQLGALLSELEDAWVDSGFTLSRDALLERAAESIVSEG